MKSLDQHNQERREWRDKLSNLNEPHPNGIACPKEGCDGELWDSNPSMVLTSNPPQKNVHCPACGYYGFRIA